MSDIVLITADSVCRDCVKQTSFISRSDVWTAYVGAQYIKDSFYQDISKLIQAPIPDVTKSFAQVVK